MNKKKLKKLKGVERLVAEVEDFRGGLSGSYLDVRLAKALQREYRRANELELLIEEMKNSVT